jgi:hypothetical protein
MFRWSKSFQDNDRLKDDKIREIGSFAAVWGIESPKGTMFVWAKIPEKFRSLGSAVRGIIKVLA